MLDITRHEMCFDCFAVSQSDCIKNNVLWVWHRFANFNQVRFHHAKAIDLQQSFSDSYRRKSEFRSVENNPIFLKNFFIQNRDYTSIKYSLQNETWNRIPFQKSRHKNIRIDYSIMLHRPFLAASISALISSKDISEAPARAASAESCCMVFSILPAIVRPEAS